MNESLILLQAKLDEAKSKKNINADINKIQNQIDKLKLQPEIDPKTLSNITKQLESILNQKIDISNISFDSKTGQQLGNSIAKNVTDSTEKTTGSVSSKVQVAASKTISSVGKSVVSSIISKGIELVFNGVDNWVHKTEKVKEETTQLQSESNSSKSNLEFMNSELQITKEKIEELEKKSKLSFTENAELERLKEHNNELERSISLEEKINKAKNIKAVASISDNQKGLDKDFNKSLKKYKKQSSRVENLQTEIQKRSENNAYDSEDIALVEKNLAKQEDKLDERYSDVLEGIANYEVDKQSILDKYNGDYSSITGNDKRLYDSRAKLINDAYETIYSDEEYNKLVIEPLFDTEGLEGVQDELFSYFADGGKLDETALRQTFGDSIINMLQQACEMAGIEFPDMLQRMSDSANDNLNKSASKVSNSNLQRNADTNIKKQSIGEAWSSLEDSKDEERKNTQADLLELAKAGQLTEETFHNTTGADTFLDSINKGLPEAIDWINNLVTSSDQLSYLQSNISSIQNAFSDFQENGSASAETLADMSDELKNLDGWDDFAETLGDSSSTAEECRKAMNKLATEYVNSNNFLSQLNDSNKDYYISTLSNMGVENAEEVVLSALANRTNALAAERKFCAEKGYELSNASFSEIDGFIKEQGYSQGTANALYRCAIEKKLVNGTTLDFSGDITSLSNFINEVAGANGWLATLAKNKGVIPAAPSEAQNFHKRKAEEELKNGSDTEIKINPPSNNNSGGGGGGNSSKQKDSKQTIDWIERKLEVLQKTIDKTKARFENLFSLNKKKNNLNDQISQTNELLKAAKKAVIAYDKQAKKVQLSKDKKTNKKLKEKVRKGDYNINDYSSSTAEKINKYKDYYDKYKEEQKQVIELTTAIRKLREEKHQLHVDDANARVDKSKAWMELDAGNYEEQAKHLNTQKKWIKESYKYQIKIANLNKDSIKKSQLKAEKKKALLDIEKQRFDNIANQYENELDYIQYEQDAISRQVDLIKARGDMLDQSKYQSQIALENQKIASLQQEKQLLVEQAKKLMKNSDLWHEAQEAIAGIDEEIAKSNQSIAEMTKSINEIGDTLRKKVLDSFERVKTESSWLVDLMDKVDDFDDQTHAVTNEGIARLGSFISNSDISKQQGDFAKAWLEELESHRDSNGEAHFRSVLTDTDINYTADEWEQAHKDAFDNVRNYYKDFSDYKNKAIDWEISKLKNELSIMKDIIDAKRDSLKAEKDLHNYQKSIQQSTKNIGLLQKQIAAVQGDNSEEGIARMQRLQKELADAQDDLNETEYDRYMSDQEELLDKLYQEYEELINSESKQREVLFNRAIQDADNNTNTIVKTNQEYADALGYKFETNIQNLYGQNTSISNNVASILSALQTGIIVSNLSGSQGGQESQDNQSGQSPGTDPKKDNFKKKLYKNAAKAGITDIKTIPSFLSKPLKKEDIDEKDFDFNELKYVKTALKSLAEAGIISEGSGINITNNKWGEDFEKAILAYKKEIMDKTDGSGDIIGEPMLKSLLNTVTTYGFSSGGMVSELQKVASNNGDDAWTTVKRGEDIFTPLQSKTFNEKFIPRMDTLINSSQILDGLVKNANFERPQTPTTIDAHYEFNLENCENATDIIRQIQTDPKIRKALQDVTINQLHTSGKSLSVNRFI